MGAYLILVLVALLAGGAMAESSDDCTNVIISMSPCLNYITGNSSSSPSAGCCTQLSTVVRNNPRCLCQVLTGGGSTLGLNINQTQALALPASCNVQTPPVNRCTVGSPSGSPHVTSSSLNSSRSGGGSTNSTLSGATKTSIKLTTPLLLLIPIPLVASYVSTFMGC